MASKKDNVIDLASRRQKRQLAMFVDVPAPPPTDIPKPLKGGKRLHVLGYCKVAEEASKNVELVLEPIQVVRRKAGIGWAWVDGLCPSCRQMGGTLLFNRCVAERLAHEKGEEPTEVRQRRLDRRVEWFASRIAKEKGTIDFHHSRMTAAKKRLDDAGKLLASDVELP